MRFLTVFFLLFITTLTFSQEKKGKLFFETSLCYGRIDFKPKSSIDIQFKTFVDEIKQMTNANLGIGWLYKNNLTLGFKTGVSFYSWDRDRYYKKLEENNNDTFFYPNYFEDSVINIDNVEGVFSLELGYLLKLKKITLKPNVEFGVLFGHLNETSYAYRLSTENLPTFVRSTPLDIRSLYAGASLDVGVPRWERFLLHFGYGFSPYNVDVQVRKVAPDGAQSSTIQTNKFESHRFTFGLKFALLKR